MFEKKRDGSCVVTLSNASGFARKMAMFDPKEFRQIDVGRGKFCCCLVVLTLADLQQHVGVGLPKRRSIPATRHFLLSEYATSDETEEAVVNILVQREDVNRFGLRFLVKSKRNGI